MKLKRPLIVAGAVTSVGLAGVTGLGIASAATPSGSTESFADKLATRFNLDKSEVQTFFEEEKTAHMAERQQKIEERLDKLVEQGKLTEAQKDVILAKHAELKAEMESMHQSHEDMTREERRAQMQQHREELQEWAEENDIPAKYLRFIFGFYGHGHGAMHDGAKPDDLSE